MDDQTKRTLLASVLCLGVLLIWMRFFSPTPPTPTTTQSTTQSTTAPYGEGRNGAIAAEDSANGDSVLANGGLYAEGGDASSAEMITLGDDRPGDENPYTMRVEINPRGAAVHSVHLSKHREKVVKKGETSPAYELLGPTKDSVSGDEFESFRVERIRFLDSKDDVDLSDLVWRASDIQKTDNGESVTLSASVFESGVKILELSREFSLAKGKIEKHIQVHWNIKSVVARPLKIAIVEDGPTGFEPADTRYDHPRVMTTCVDSDGGIYLNQALVRSEVFKAEDHRKQFICGEDRLFWSAVSNKYFTCIVFPRPNDESKPGAQYLDRVVAKTNVPRDEIADDLTFEQWIVPPGGLASRGEFNATIDVYCGEKRDKTFEAMPLAVARHYVIVKEPDGSICTFETISAVMRWLLAKVYNLIGNYGIAIILLVVIVRTVLHPITKKGQINMMKMQKNTQRLKPKIDALQKLHKNDKQKLNEETMRLYREEGINPLNTVFGCIPMLLQTPIWIALYTTLNTDVSIRHQAFFGYIRDLSAPDQLIDFHGSFSIPLLSAIMGPISALNILPIIMAIVMLAQMRLSQKIAKNSKEQEQKEKVESGTEEKAEANPMQDTLAQQQKMMTYMMPFFGLLFYNMPSGLCLYILSNSLLGMGELYFIRKHLRELEDKGELFKKPNSSNKPKGRFQKWLEDLQKQAEQQRMMQSSGGGKQPGARQGQKKKKKPRF